MAFDFNSCQLVGPDENRLGSGLIAPQRAADRPETEVLRLGAEWCWPGRAEHVPKPWEKEAVIHEAIRKPITRFSLEAKISYQDEHEKTKTIAIMRAQHWVPYVEFPDEFYGFHEIPWKNLHEMSVSADEDVRMDFIEPDPIALSEVRKKGASVDAERICEIWNKRTEEVRRLALKRDMRYRLLRECVRVFAYGGIVRIAYTCHGAECIVWFNLGNMQVHVEKGEGGFVGRNGMDE